MTFDPIPHLDAVRHRALADADPSTWLAALVAAGRHLRDPRLTASEKRAVRSAMPHHVRTEAHLGATRALAESYARDALAGVRRARFGRTGRLMRAVASRDDLESVAFALAAAHIMAMWPGVEPVAMPGSLLAETDWLRDVTRAIDRMAHDGRTIDRILAWGARGRFARDAVADREAPPWLLAMVDPGANPWWLDAIDPVMVAARRHFSGTT